MYRNLQNKSIHSEIDKSTNKWFRTTDIIFAKCCDWFINISIVTNMATNGSLLRQVSTAWSRSTERPRWIKIQEAFSFEFFFSLITFALNFYAIGNLQRRVLKSERIFFSIRSMKNLAHIATGDLEFIRDFYKLQYSAFDSLQLSFSRFQGPLSINQCRNIFVFLVLLSVCSPLLFEWFVDQLKGLLKSKQALNFPSKSFVCRSRWYFQSTKSL